MKQAAVSVVIPTYNRADMIRDAIDSILAQTLPPSQIIVIDDGSKDNTAEKLLSYGDRVLYRPQANAGPSAARNHGIRLASQPLGAFLDADDVWHPRKLEFQMRLLERDPELGMIGTDNFDWPIAAFPEAPENADELVASVTWEQLVVKTSILTSSVLIRRDVLSSVGEFDSSLCGPEDRDMFLRIAEITRIAMIRVPLIGYRDSPGSLTKQALIHERGMREILSRLDQRDAWRGRRLLRRKAISCMHVRCSDAQARAGNHGAAVLRILKSLAWYPLPYRSEEAALWMERPRRLAVNLLRLAHLKRPDGGPAGKPPLTGNALRGSQPESIQSISALRPTA